MSDSSVLASKPAAPSPYAHAARTPRRRVRRWQGVGFVVALLCVVGVAGAMRGWWPSLFRAALDDATLFTVVPTTLQITLNEDGELKPVNSRNIVNTVEGQRVTIEWIVEESTEVKEGDLLVRLSSDEMKERFEMEEIELKARQRAVSEAEEELFITCSENESRIKKAEIDLTVAELELARYRNGEYQEAVKQAFINITQTEADLRRKHEELEKNLRLLEQEFIPASEIDRLHDEIDRLARMLDKYCLAMEILDTYEYPKNEIQKTAAVAQAAGELDRERKRAESRERQARAKVDDQKQQLEIRERRFERLREQLAGCELRSPLNGVVRYGEAGYGRFFGGSRIAVGEQVYPGQVILAIPDTSQMLVSTRIHEADRHKVSIGLPCIVKVPAVPGRSFSGKLQKIAQFADSSRSWWNPNLKEHAVEIMLDDTDAPLSPGDTAHIDILIEEVRDVLAVPIQSVFSRGSKHFVFRKKALSADPVEVTLGRSTSTMVEITSGLRAGDQIVMAPDERMMASLPVEDTTREPAPAPDPQPHAVSVQTVGS